MELEVEFPSPTIKMKGLNRMSRELLTERYEKEFEKLPDFIQNYLLHLEAIPRSTNTLYEYAKEYRRFLTWLSTEKIIAVKDISEIRLADFERLNKGQH